MQHQFLKQMKDTKTVTEFDFANDKWIKQHFSNEGAKALYAYLTNLEDEMRDEIEFDPIGIITEWEEYKDLEALNEDYNMDYDFETLCGDTQVIDIDKERLIVMNF